MLWSKRYRFWYQLHRINILVCSWTGPVVYVEGVNSRLDEDRQKIYLALGKNTFHQPNVYFKAKEIYLHVVPPTARYLTVEYRTRVKRQLQGLRGTFLSNIEVLCRKDESWGYPSIGHYLSEKKNSMFFSVFKYDELEDT